MLSPLHNSSLPRRGFTLVEIVLAIGLVAFGLVVVISLLPVGLGSMSDSSRQIVETEIFSTVGAELNSTKFDELENYAASRFPVYFDNEGAEVAAGTTAVYTARCRFSPPENSGQLRRVTVLIGFHTDPSGGNAGNTAERPFLMVRKE
jgi:uncharacterized protein (TIGR02598 family)